MPLELPKLFLARHGDTAWTESRQHTGRTDLPLNKSGEERAGELGERLRKFSFACVFTSPLQRASKTCELAGFGAVARIDPDLMEWDYGRFEGMLTRDILKMHPGWELFRDACPESESPDDVAARADGLIDRVRRIAGDFLAFSSAHIIRMIAADGSACHQEQDDSSIAAQPAWACSGSSTRNGMSPSSSSGTTLLDHGSEGRCLRHF
jgi:probable phosphoglycerate mutase